MQASSPNTRARTRTHTLVRCKYRDGRLFSLPCLRATFSRTDSCTTRVPPFSPLSIPFISVEAARRGASSRPENTITFFSPSEYRRGQRKILSTTLLLRPTWKISVIFRLTAARVDSGRSEGVNWRTRRGGKGKDERSRVISSKFAPTFSSRFDLRYYRIFYNRSLNFFTHKYRTSILPILAYHGPRKDRIFACK